MKEKREAVRYVPRVNVFAALECGTSFMFGIKDISKDGLAFEHFIELNKAQHEMKPMVIFIEDGAFYLANLSCTMIYDKPLRTDCISPGNFKPKLCGVKFNTLTSQQMGQLAFFLKKYTAPIEKKYFPTKNSIHSCELQQAG